MQYKLEEAWEDSISHNTKAVTDATTFPWYIIKSLRQASPTTPTMLSHHGKGRMPGWVFLGWGKAKIAGSVCQEYTLSGKSSKAWSSIAA